MPARIHSYACPAHHGSNSATGSSSSSSSSSSNNNNNNNNSRFRGFTRRIPLLSRSLLNVNLFVLWAVVLVSFTSPVEVFSHLNNPVVTSYHHLVRLFTTDGHLHDSFLAHDRVKNGAATDNGSELAHTADLDSLGQRLDLNTNLNINTTTTAAGLTDDDAAATPSLTMAALFLVGLGMLVSVFVFVVLTTTLLSWRDRFREAQQMRLPAPTTAPSRSTAIPLQPSPVKAPDHPGLGHPNHGYLPPGLFPSSPESLNPFRDPSPRTPTVIFPNIPLHDVQPRPTSTVPPVAALVDQLQPVRHPNTFTRQKDSYTMTMGLRRLMPGPWLEVDSSYPAFHAVRDALLTTKKDQVLSLIPTSDVDAACREVLELVIDELSRDYPTFFTVTRDASTQRVTSVHNHLANEHWQWTTTSHPIGKHALEIAARLAAEDFSILLKDAEGGEHRLIASATLFPAGWILPHRIGRTLTQLHGPVPAWKPTLSSPVEKFFSRLTPASPMERATYFVQVRPTSRSLAATLFVQDASAFFPAADSAPAPLTPDDILVRRERQTFRRLPACGGVLFGVRTTVTALPTLERAEVEGLLREVRGWPVEVARYKGRDVWIGVVEDWAARIGVRV